MSTCVLIPIKTNNERLPGKNTRPLRGYPLYAWLFQTLTDMSGIDTIYVDSTDESILRIAREWQFTPLKRPVEYNGNTITGNELLMRVVDDIPHEFISLLHVTSPFLTAPSIRKGFDLLAEDPTLDSVFGVMSIRNRLWYEGAPVNHDIEKLKRTQDLIPVYEETDVYFMRRDSLQRYGKRVCGNFRYFEMDTVESTDLDDLVDFIRAESLLDAGLVPHAYTAKNTHQEQPKDSQ